MSGDNPRPLETGSPVGWNETLLKMARPDIYRVNAFRILDLPVTASPKEISSRMRELDLMEKYGDVEQHDSSFFPLSAAHDSDARSEARQRLLDPELRFIDEFFWFWPLSLNSTGDSDDAFIGLKENDLWRALSIWQRHEVKGSEANVSMHNIAVLYHAMALDIECIETGRKKVSKQQVVDQKRYYWEQAFSRWKMLLDDEGFWQRARERIRELDDPRLTAGTVRRIREGLPVALLSINAQLAVEAAEMDDLTDMGYHLVLMRQSGFDNTIVGEAIHRAVVPIRDGLKAMCTHAREETGNVPERDHKVATDLMNYASLLLKNLDLLLPEGDAIREAVHDEVALQVRSCLISYINETGNWRSALTLAKKALVIAASPSVQQKIQDDVDTMDSNLEYATCWFCGTAPADEGSTVQVMMHGSVQRNRKWSGTEVQWQRLPVPVPRCRACKSAHEQRRNLGCGGAIVGLILAILLGIASSNILVGLIIFAVSWVGGYVTSLLTFPKGIKAESHKNEFRTVKELQSQGWKIGEKPEGVS